MAGMRCLLLLLAGVVVQAQLVTMKTVRTRYGEVTMKLIGDVADKTRVPVIALPGAAAELRDEWVPFATKLVTSMNCVCALVYLDSLPKPWIVKDISDVVSVQVLHNTLRAEKAVVMGKSFGGLLAHEFALFYPKQVHSLVLFAPATANKELVERLCNHNPKIPIFLGWSHDDGSFPHHAKYTHNCPQEEFVFHSEYYGGHAITEEYFKYMTEFLTLHKPSL